MNKLCSKYQIGDYMSQKFCKSSFLFPRKIIQLNAVFLQLSKKILIE